MTASRLVPVEHAIPALTDHVEDNGGVIGLRIGGRGGGFFNAAIGRPFWKWPKHGTNLAPYTIWAGGSEHRACCYKRAPLGTKIHSEPRSLFA